MALGTPWLVNVAPYLEALMTRVAWSTSMWWATFTAASFTVSATTLKHPQKLSRPRAMFISSIIALYQDYAMNYWKSQGAPAEKLIVGFPTYGNTFTLSNPANHGVGAAISGAGTPGKYTQEAGELAYFEVRFLVTIKQIKQQKTSERWWSFRIYHMTDSR